MSNVKGYFFLTRRGGQTVGRNIFFNLSVTHVEEKHPLNKKKIISRSSLMAFEYNFDGVIQTVFSIT